MAGLNRQHDRSSRSSCDESQSETEAPIHNEMADHNQTTIKEFFSEKKVIESSSTQSHQSTINKFFKKKISEKKTSSLQTTFQKKTIVTINKTSAKQGESKPSGQSSATQTTGKPDDVNLDDKTTVARFYVDPMAKPPAKPRRWDGFCIFSDGLVDMNSSPPRRGSADRFGRDSSPVSPRPKLHRSKRLGSNGSWEMSESGTDDRVPTASPSPPRSWMSSLISPNRLRDFSASPSPQPGTSSSAFAPKK